MGKRDDLIAKHCEDLQETCGMTADKELMKKVCIGLGPALYKQDAQKVAAGDPEEMDRIKKNFLMKKLGLPEGPELDAGMDAMVEKYGRSNRNKQRAVFYYLLVKHFGKESVYG